MKKGDLVMGIDRTYPRSVYEVESRHYVHAPGGEDGFYGLALRCRAYQGDVFKHHHDEILHIRPEKEFALATEDELVQSGLKTRMPTKPDIYQYEVVGMPLELKEPPGPSDTLAAGRACSCDMTTIMRTGCTCGGK